MHAPPFGSSLWGLYQLVAILWRMLLLQLLQKEERLEVASPLFLPRRVVNQKQSRQNSRTPGTSSFQKRPGVPTMCSSHHRKRLGHPALVWPHSKEGMSSTSAIRHPLARNRSILCISYPGHALAHLGKMNPELGSFIKTRLNTILELRSISTCSTVSTCPACTTFRKPWALSWGSATMRIRQASAGQTPKHAKTVATAPDNSTKKTRSSCTMASMTPFLTSLDASS